MFLPLDNESNLGCVILREWEGHKIFLPYFVPQIKVALGKTEGRKRQNSCKSWRNGGLGTMSDLSVLQRVGDKWPAFAECPRSILAMIITVKRNFFLLVSEPVRRTFLFLRPIKTVNLVIKEMFPLI